MLSTTFFIVFEQYFRSYWNKVFCIIYLYEDASWPLIEISG